MFFHIFCKKYQSHHSRLVTHVYTCLKISILSLSTFNKSRFLIAGRYTRIILISFSLMRTAICSLFPMLPTAVFSVTSHISSVRVRERSESVPHILMAQSRPILTVMSYMSMRMIFPRQNRSRVRLCRFRKRNISTC